MLGTTFFLVVALVSVVSAAMVVVLRNPVHSALSLVVALFTIAVFFLSLAAEFLAAVQVLIYAGAIMVLFLFVITLLNPLQPETPDRLRNQAVFAGLLALVLLVEMALIVRTGALDAVPVAAPALEYESNVKALGQTLFTVYMIPFQATALLLLIAIVGAVALARRTP